VTELEEVIQCFEIIGDWVIKRGLPDPEAIWEAWRDAPAVASGLLARIKEVWQSFGSNPQFLLTRARYEPSEEIAEMLYFLFVLKEYHTAVESLKNFEYPPEFEVGRALVYTIQALQRARSPVSP